MLSVQAPSEAPRATLHVPGDKSIGHRSLILSALANGDSLIRGLPASEDVATTRRALEALGVAIEDTPEGHVIVHGKGPEGFRSPDQPIDCGNSGTTARLLTGLLAAIPGVQAELIGDASLTKRPMDRVVHPLKAMGAEITFLGEGECLPFRIEGRELRRIEYTVPVVSAQVKSALLLAGMLSKEESSIHEPTPTRDHTELMLRAMGAKLQTSPEGEGFRHLVERGPLSPMEFDVPGDMSSAAYFFTLGALMPGSEIRVNSVNLNPRRKGLLETLTSLGARFEIDMHENTIEPRGDVRCVQQIPRVKGTPPIKLGTLPSMIDEMPLLAVVATQIPTNIRIMGGYELRLKEADRITGMTKGLSAMGAHINEHRDGWEILGSGHLRGAQVDGCHDHRIIMSYAIAACLARGTTRIEGADWVKISFPGFWDELSKCGAIVAGLDEVE